MEERIKQLKAEGKIEPAYPDNDNLRDLYRIVGTHFIVSYFCIKSKPDVEFFRARSNGCDICYRHLDDLPKYENNKDMKKEVEYIKKLFTL